MDLIDLESNDLLSQITIGKLTRGYEFGRSDPIVWL